MNNYAALANAVHDAPEGSGFVSPKGDLAEMRQSILDLSEQAAAAKVRLDNLVTRLYGPYPTEDEDEGVEAPEAPMSEMSELAEAIRRTERQLNQCHGLLNRLEAL